MTYVCTSLQERSIGLMTIRHSYYFHYPYCLCYYTCSKVDSGYSSDKERFRTGNGLNNLIRQSNYVLASLLVVVRL